MKVQNQGSVVFVAVVTLLCVGGFIYLHEAPIVSSINFQQKEDLVENITKCKIQEKPTINEQSRFQRNALMYGYHRQTKGFLTIGIPTGLVEFPPNYLWNTIESLLNNSNEKEKREIVIVVFVTDFDPALQYQYGKLIAERYREEVGKGQIQVIKAPREFYLKSSHFKETYRHPLELMNWNSRENIHIAFLMKYCQKDSYIKLKDSGLC